MRHRSKTNNLSRTAAHRKAMLANMACSLIEHKRINTTVPKAKALRSFVEPLITRSKTDSTHSRRMVFRQLKDKHAVSELFREVAPKIADRQGGYTRIIKTGFRLGDAADMCLIELVDFNEVYVSEKKAAKKTRRSRRGGGGAKKTEAAAVAAEAAPEAAAEAPEVATEEVKAEAAEAAAPEAEAPAAEDTQDAAEDNDNAEDSKDAQ